MTLVLLAGLVACDGDSRGRGSDVGDASGSGAVDPAAAALARGELLSFACQACHSLAPGGPHIVGPNLSGIFGRAAGTAPGFDNYSAALLDAGIVWSPAVLDRWLEDPAGFLAGTTMAFTGYRSAADRAALIAFLVEATAVPEAGTDPDAAAGRDTAIGPGTD